KSARSADATERSILHRHHQILHDEVLPLRRVLAHVEGQDAAGFGLRRVLDAAEPHVFSDELLELAWRNFAQAFEARDLGLRADLLDRGFALGVAVTVNRLLLVPHPEQRRLEHEEMSVVHELIEEAEEVSDHQIA